MTTSTSTGFEADWASGGASRNAKRQPMRPSARVWRTNMVLIFGRVNETPTVARLLWRKIRHRSMRGSANRPGHTLYGQQHNGNEQGCENRPSVEYVDIGHERGLAGDRLADDPEGMGLRGSGRRALVGEVLSHPLQRRVNHRRRRDHVFDEA